MSNDFKDLLDQPDDESGQGNEPTRGLGDLLGGLMGGAGGNSPAGADIGSLLGGLMGGGGASGSAPSSGDIESLLGGLMGGGGTSGGTSGGMGGLLGSLLGGGSGAGMGGDQYMPFIGPLAEKLGLSPQMANMLAMAAIGLLTSSMAKNRDAGRSGGVDMAALSDPDYLRSTGVASRLSAQMGISEDDAINGLQQAMGMMAGSAAGATPQKPAPSPAGKQPAKKTTSSPKPAAANKPASKKPPAKKTGSDFMDLLDDPPR